MEQHTLALGKLVTNLLALETMLRFFLSDIDARAGIPQASLDDLLAASKGAVFVDCALTNHDSLSTVINKYNAKVTANLAINRDEIVSLRDAIAHGRLISRDPTPPLSLFKFSKPADGTVTVTVSETLTLEWLQECTSRIHRDLQNVIAAGGQLFTGKLFTQE